MERSVHSSRAILSTRRTSLYGASLTKRVATLCHAGGIDIDLAQPPLGGTKTALRVLATETSSDIVWVGASASLGKGSVIAESVIPNCERCLNPLLVVEAVRRTSDQSRAIGTAYQLGEQLISRGTGGQIAIGLRSHHLSGGRRHLASLTLLRRQAEEWGLLIALDLTGAFDPLWEAEAAILRLGPRLAALRITAETCSPAAADIHRVARRALRATIEQRRDARISIEPRVPWWHCRRAAAIAASWTAAADHLPPLSRSLVADTYPIVEEERRRRSLPPR